MVAKGITTLTHPPPWVLERRAIHGCPYGSPRVQVTDLCNSIEKEEEGEMPGLAQAVRSEQWEVAALLLMRALLETTLRIPEDAIPLEGEERGDQG